MGTLTLDITCPHCLKENAFIEAFAERRQGAQPIFDVAFSCRSCDKSLIASIATTVPGGSGPLSTAKNGHNLFITKENNQFILLKHYPQVEQHSAPEMTPARAAKFFIEAKDDFARGRFETSAMNCRKVIDIATKELHLGNEDKLVRRISALREKGMITQEMADWAHIVRIDTNGAIHSDEEFTSQEVAQLLNFTEVFLLYSFTLPAMVSNKRTEN